jgi:hypothetical protein
MFFRLPCGLVCEDDPEECDSGEQKGSLQLTGSPLLGSLC